VFKDGQRFLSIYRLPWQELNHRRNLQAVKPAAAAAVKPAVVKPAVAVKPTVVKPAVVAKPAPAPAKPTVAAPPAPGPAKPTPAPAKPVVAKPVTTKPTAVPAKPVPVPVKPTVGAKAKHHGKHKKHTKHHGKLSIKHKFHLPKPKLFHIKIKSHGENLANVNTKTSKLAQVLEKNIANLGKINGDYLKKLALFKKMMEVMAKKKIELRNAKASKQAAYKVVLNGKTQLSSQVNKHIDAKVRHHKALLSKIAGHYHTLATQARAYNSKANSKLAGYQAGLLKVKYTHKNEYAKFKRQYSKTKGKHNKALGKWKRGIQRFMTTMFDKLKNTCTLKMDVKVHKKVHKKTHKKKIHVKIAAKHRRLQKLVAKVKKNQESY